MIPFEIEYYKPASVAEALDTYHRLYSRGKYPVYYAGGTELISMARRSQIHMDAVIDLKGIPECGELGIQAGRVVIGAAVSLTRLAEANPFPLLSQHSRGIADHNSRSRITVGGNIAGKTVYREAVLPLLICDTSLVIARQNGLETVSIHDVFDKELRLNPGEFLVQMLTDEKDAGLPYVSLKKTRFSKIDYPLVSVAAVMKQGRMRVAISGVCDHPFRSKPMEETLRDSSLSPEQRIARAISQLPGPVVSDINGSDEYRIFLLEQALADTIRQLEGEVDS